MPTANYENIQLVLDTEGYAECPDCGSRIHCGSVGLANLEKRHRGKKICRETKAKRDKNMKAKKNGSLLTFFNHPKATSVPSTILRIQPVHSPTLTQETVEAAVPHRDEQIAPVRTTTLKSAHFSKSSTISQKTYHTQSPRLLTTTNLLSLEEIQQALMTRPLIVKNCGKRR